jgi:hypothetical protein
MEKKASSDGLYPPIYWRCVSAEVLGLSSSRQHSNEGVVNYGSFCESFTLATEALSAVILSEDRWVPLGIF